MNLTTMTENIDSGKNSDARYSKSILPNGVKIISENVPTVESFALGVFINAGSRDEKPDLPGVAHFIEHAAFRRTKTRTSRKIATGFESLGAYTNAFTTQENTCFYVRALKENFAKCAELLADIVINPLYKESEINKERQIIIEEIKSYEDDPEEYILDMGDRLVFGNHPLGNPIVGTKESLDEIDIPDLEQFRTDYYYGNNIIVAFAGNIDHNYALETLTEYFQDIPQNPEILHVRTIPAIVKPDRIILNKQIQQSHLLLACRIEGLLAKDRYETALLNTIFGDGMSSKLYQSLREKHGLAYTVYSSLELQSDSGAFYIYTGCDPTNIQNAEELIFEEMSKILKNGINNTEINRAKEQLKSGLVMELESMSERMRSLVKSEILFGNIEPVSTVIERIEKIGKDAILSVAGNYFKPELWSAAIILQEGE